MICPFSGKSPRIERKVFVAHTAALIGDVKIEEDVSIWFGAVIRGDIETISIGKGSNVQDNCTIHTSKGFGVEIGDYVTVGHNAVLHGCTIKSNTLIGMGAIVLDGAIVEENCLIGAGSLVPPGKVIPTGSLVMGSPAKVVRKLGPEEIEKIKKNAEHYIALKAKY